MDKKWCEAVDRTRGERCIAAKENAKKCIASLESFPAIKYDFYTDTDGERVYRFCAYALKVVKEDLEEREKRGNDPLNFAHVLSISYLDSAEGFLRHLKMEVTRSGVACSTEEFNEISKLVVQLERSLNEMSKTAYSYGSLLGDTEKVEMDGDIIITDPGYLQREFSGVEFENESDDDFLEIPNLVWKDTLYGDWSCTTYDVDTKRVFGHFCADGGMVCVVPLENVLAYNPDYKDHLSKDWTTTLIKDFKGEVQIVVKQYNGASLEEDGVDAFYVSVVGEGINKKTGEPIKFFTSQTGF